MRYFIHLAYHGAGFCGWQIQPDTDTVQARINSALSQLLNERISCIGCGRTDAGVHASSFYTHFSTEKELPNRFSDRLNSVLPQAITVFNVLPMHEKAHTRYDAVSRTYEYYIHFKKAPFLSTHSFYLQYPDTDWDRVNSASALLPTFSDFTSLCRPSDDFKTNICNVTEARWESVKRPAVAGHGEDEFMRFTITSNRFLRGMVRKIVGTMLLVGKHKISLVEFEETVRAQKDFIRSISAPPQGLYLTDVKYPYSVTGEKDIIL